jgi:hypothetical protein
MDIDSIQRLISNQAIAQKDNNTDKSDFSKILDTKLRIASSDYISNSMGNGNIITGNNKRPLNLLLGEISKSHPTVSHLLIDHPEYQKSCWKIIHSEQNRHKPYTKIVEGTKIYINATNLDISWDKVTAKTDDREMLEPNILQSEIQTDNDTSLKVNSFSENFVDAVKQSLGEKYDQIDCYELVVQGLRKLGYRYGGYGGIKETLINMALSKGESINTYLSGEGLIEASGTPQYVKSIDVFSDHQDNANAIMKEMLPVIKPGQILSFSTPSRGHTGIIASKGDQWTYVNSGILDNNVNRSVQRKGVGEESLPLEILNWVKIAARKKESLIITLGRLDEEKLEKYKPIPWDA